MTRHRRYLPWLCAAAVLIAIALLAACAPVTPPLDVTPPAAPWSIAFDVWAAGKKVPGARLEVDIAPDQPHLQLVADAEGNATAHVPPTLVVSHVWVTAEGYRPYDAHLPTESCRTAADAPCGERLSDGARISIDLVPLAPPTPRLRVQGRRFVRPDGSTWLWRGLTGFRLVEMVAHGREAEAEAFLAWAQHHRVTVVRALTVKALEAGNYFELSAADGRAAVPRLLQLAAAHGVYVEVVALADTALRRFDHQAHVRAIGEACAVATNCLVEIANEPIHSTQDPRLADPAYLLALRRLIPADVPVALGAAHGGDDASLRFIGGDYVTVHADRADGDGGWRWVRHTRELWDTAIAAGKPVVNDEPMKADLAPDKHYGVGYLMAMLSLGDTFHWQDGIQAKPPTGTALAAFEARRRGWDEVGDWTGLYYSVSDTAGPFAAANVPRDGYSGWTALRAYSSVNGANGHGIALGVRGDPGVAWRAPWQVAGATAFGGVRTWRIRQ